jgi:Na+/melibiose symporter-like transporter
VWQVLSIINKALLLLVCGVSIYTLALSLRSLFAVHRLKTAARDQRLVNTSLGGIRRRLWNLRQSHLFSLYFFGFCIVFQIPGIFHTVAVSYDLPPLTVIRTLAFLCYFDATIFLIFLLIHSAQWFASARVDSLLRNHD